MNIILISVCWILSLMTIIFLALYLVKPYLNNKIELRDKETKNKKYELFMNISPELMTTSIDNYFEIYINRYITYKFISKKVLYIKQEEVDKMVKDLTELIYIEISELYVFYISMTTSISNDDDLIKFIHSKVMNKCVESVLNYNNSMIG